MKKSNVIYLAYYFIGLSIFNLGISMHNPQERDYFSDLAMEIKYEILKEAINSDVVDIINAKLNPQHKIIAIAKRMIQLRKTNHDFNNLTNYYISKNIPNLLNTYNIDINDKNQDDFTVLHLAVKSNAINIVKLLLEFGANINAKDSLGGFTPLIWTVLKKYYDIAKLLLNSKADIKETCNFGRSAFLWAVYKGHKNLVKLFIKHGTDVNEKDDLNYNALLIATLSKKKGIVKLLLDNGINVNEKDRRGNTALMEASKNNLNSIVKLLIKSGANVSQENYQNYNALIYAIKNKNKKIAKILMKVWLREKLENI